ncbi:MAG TPA: YbaK/EbsC family protein [Candidatus Limnocylindrales bacterium]
MPGVPEVPGAPSVPEAPGAALGVPDPVTVSTPAIEAVRALGVPHRIVTNPRPQTAEESAELQGIALDQLFRTIVVRRGADDYVFVLVPGGRRFDWPKLRAHLGVSRLSLPDKDEARAVTGYERGTITPFGASRAWPVIVDASAAALDSMSIGGGAFGVNLHVAPDDLIHALDATVVDVTVPEDAQPSE